MLLLCVDLHWHLRPAQDTGRESGNFERETEVTVVTERSIMEGRAMTDHHMSAADPTVACLSGTAIAPHRTVWSTLHLVTVVNKG